MQIIGPRFSDPAQRRTGSKPNGPITMNLERVGPKVGLWWGDSLFGKGDDQIGAKNTESDGPMSQGERTPRPRMWIPNSSRFPGAPFFLVPPFLFSGRSLMLYISFSLVHPLPTLVSHPCPYLSARPIGYSFWRSVSCCGPHRTVQGSRPHKWG